MKNFLEYIEEKLNSKLKPKKILLIDNSHLHVKHKSFDPNRFHLKLVIESEYLKNMKKHERFGNDIYTISLRKLDSNTHNLRGKWGYFYEYSLQDLNKIKNYVNNKYQTLTYFGLKKNILKNFVIKNNLSGIDRIVPIGQALDISFFWDGYDLNKILSRVVDIK